MLDCHIPLLDSWGAPLLAFVFATLLWLQWKHPLRLQKFALPRRIGRNLLFSLPSFLTLRLVLLPIPLAVAAWAAHNNFGLLHLFHLPLPMEVACGVLAMDYAYYWWHVATHRVGFLWRFHNVHHTDLDMDVSTATRFHAGELGLSVGFRVAVVALVGIAPLALIVFEIAFEACGQFHHSNWRLNPRFETLLNRILVSPRMHGIHHSIVLDEADSNWGTIFSWWDKIHRTKRLDIAQNEITIGVPAFRDEEELNLKQLFLLPFAPLRPWKTPDGETPKRDVPPPDAGNERP